jgi:hypothetical protein
VSEPGPRVESPPEPSATPGGAGTSRAAHAIAQLYYYLVAAVGVAFVLGGVIGLLMGVRTLVLPDEFEESRDAVRTMLQSLLFVLTGLALAWWHLGEARRGEGKRVATAFWGRALYFHLVAFVALWFAVGGVIGMLSAGVEAALPRCAPTIPPEEAELIPEGQEIPRECYPEPAEAGRRAVDGAIFVIAASPLWWWHLRQGRRGTGGASPG